MTANGAPQRQTKAPAKRQRDPEDDVLNAQEQRRANPELSRSDKRKHRHEVQADAARPAEELQGHKLDSEGPICEGPGCEMQQAVEHDGLCVYHNQLVEDTADR